MTITTKSATTIETGTTTIRGTATKIMLTALISRSNIGTIASSTKSIEASNNNTSSGVIHTPTTRSSKLKFDSRFGCAAQETGIDKRNPSRSRSSIASAESFIQGTAARRPVSQVPLDVGTSLPT